LARQYVVALVFASGLAATAHGQTPALPTSNDPLQPQKPWLEVGSKSNSLDVPAKFQELAGARAKILFPNDAYSAEQELSGPPSLVYYKFKKIKAADLGLEGSWTWDFFADENDIATAATYTEVSDSAPYRVRIELYCTKSDMACKEAEEHLQDLIPPAPAQPKSELAGPSGDRYRALFSEWLKISGAEPCTPGPIRMNNPVYPAAEKRHRIGGLATLHLAVNACGEVKSVDIVRSTGNKNLDQAARTAAYGWRVAFPNGAHEAQEFSLEFAP
jgi:TonB family protein